MKKGQLRKRLPFLYLCGVLHGKIIDTERARIDAERAPLHMLWKTSIPLW